MKKSIITQAEKKWGIRLKGNRTFGGKQYRLMGIGTTKGMGNYPRKKYHSFRTVTYFCRTCKKRTPIYATYLHGRE